MHRRRVTCLSSPDETVASSALSDNPIRRGWKKKEKKQLQQLQQSLHDDVAHEGFLVKKGHVVRTQKERYFVLRGHVLSYYKAKRRKKPKLHVSALKGILELTACDIITRHPTADLWFRIQKLPGTDGKSYKLDLKASSNQERQEWINILRAACRETLLLKQSLRRNLSRKLTARNVRSSAMRSTQHNTILVAEKTDSEHESMTDLRATFQVFHEFILLQQLLETIRVAWGPPDMWGIEQYQKLVQSITLVQEQAGDSALEKNEILSTAFDLRYKFEEIPENQAKLMQTNPKSPSSPETEDIPALLPTEPPRLRCPTIYSYYSTFNRLTYGTEDKISSDSDTVVDDNRMPLSTTPMTPRSSTMAKYAHIYLEEDYRTKAPWGWEREKGDDLLDDWKQDSEDQGVIVKKLVDRYNRDRIYTYLNDHTMVLLNPYRILQTSKFTSIYDEQVVLAYACTPHSHTALAPHPFAMAKQSLFRLFFGDKEGSTKAEQVMVLTGESGSGKTELAKELLKYIVLMAEPILLNNSFGRTHQPVIKIFTSSTKSTIQMRIEETRTLALLEAKGVDKYEIVLLDLYPNRWAEMTNVSGSKRLPQVHIDGLFFGFYENLERLEDEDQLRMYFKNPHAAKKLSTVLDSNILLEAFGHATTSMNINSSRFGKITTLYLSYDHHPSQFQILGCQLTSFLLEKTRVTSEKGEAEHGRSDMNFHIFYAMVAGVNAITTTAMVAKDLHLDGVNCDAFIYLGRRKHKLHGSWSEEETKKKDIERWIHITEAMAALDISYEEQRMIFQVLSAVLWLGNIDFEWDSKLEKLRMTSLVTSSAPGFFMDLLGLANVDEVERMFFTRRLSMHSTGETFDVILEKGQVRHVRNTLARFLYQVVFHYIVKIMNSATKMDMDTQNDEKQFQDNDRTVRLLKIIDVFGFENLACNSLEQLCINYMTEKLTFVEEQVVMGHYYSQTSGIIPLIENGRENEVLFLFEHPLGVFACLEELTLLHQGENEDINQEQKKNKLFVRNLYQRNASRLVAVTRPPRNATAKSIDPLPFIVPHTRETTIYDANDFVNKNSDFQYTNLVDGLASSSNSLFRHMLATGNDVSNTAEKIQLSAGSSGSLVDQFRMQVHTLSRHTMGQMPLYFHCIRPNTANQPARVEESLVTQQLVAQRLHPQVTLCGRSITDITTPGYFAMEIPISLIMKRYRCLLTTSWIGDYDEKATSEDLAKLLNGHFSQDDSRPAVRVQDSILQFRTVSFVEQLDQLLEEREVLASITLQSFFRMVTYRRRYMLQQQEKKTLFTELEEFYGDNSQTKIEKILKKYQGREGDLREKLAAKRTLRNAEKLRLEKMARALKDLCVSESGGLSAETVNDILSNHEMRGLLQRDENIVRALRDMSLNPGVLEQQLTDPTLLVFYQNLLTFLQARKQRDTLTSMQQLSEEQGTLEERAQQLIVQDRDLWMQTASDKRWRRYRGMLEEIGDEPEILIFHMEDTDFIKVLEDFVSVIDSRKKMIEKQKALDTLDRVVSDEEQANRVAIDAELQEMLLKVNFDEKLMSAMNQDHYFVQALQTPTLIASMQQFMTNRQGFASQGLQNPLVREFFMKLIGLSLTLQAQDEG